MANQTAVCFGINDYPGTDSDLSGCVNDAKDWAAVLKDRGFSVTEVLDGDATRGAMIDRMTAIVTDAGPGDTAVITFSGHGTWQPDENGDEPDTRDEALCPHDLNTAGALLDDELFEIFSQAVHGASVVFLSDSCHSGSVARLAPAMGDERGRVRFMPPAVFLSEEGAARARQVERAPSTGLSRATALLISGCMDTEYSYDATFAGRPNGAFTRAAIDALPNLPSGATYVDWHTSIRSVLPNLNHPQTPQLTASPSQRSWPVLASASVQPTPAPSDPTLRSGSRGEAVERLQQALTNLGFDPGSIDGVFGRRTRAAVIAFQTSRALQVDGVVGPKTWAALHAEGQ